MLSTVPEVQTPAAAAALPQTESATQRNPLADDLQRMIAEAAYYIAERRGFEPGHEMDDWLQAEAQVFDLIAQRAR